MIVDVMVPLRIDTRYLDAQKAVLMKLQRDSDSRAAIGALEGVLQILDVVSDMAEEAVARGNQARELVDGTDGLT